MDEENKMDNRPGQGKTNVAVKWSGPDPLLSLEQRIHELTRYHPVDSPEREFKHESIRRATSFLILTIAANCPQGADRTAAIRLARQAMMTANASLALGGRTWDL